MTSEKISGDQATKLRRRAEERQKERERHRGQRPEEDRSSTETQRLIQELQIHQIELEMQNEELRRARLEMETLLTQYTDLYDFAPVGYFILSVKGMILEANLTAATLLGAARGALVKQPLTRFILPEDQNIYVRYCKQLFETGALKGCDLRMVKKDGTSFWARLEARDAQDAKSESVCRVIMSDITERRRGEDALQKEKYFVESLIETAQTIVLMLDTSGCIVTFNPYMEEISGYRLKEVQGKDWFSTFLPERDQKQTRDLFLRAVADIQTRGNVNPIVTKDGREVYIEWYDKTLKNEKGDVAGLLAIGQDVTDRRQAEVRNRLTREVLDLLNRPDGSRDTIRDILQLIKKSTGFEAAGIRLREGEDFPYYDAEGFSEDFIRTEGYLCAHDAGGQMIRDGQGNPVLECMCGNILCGRTNPDLPFFTEGGSFWTNSTTDLLASTTEEDRQARTRNRCNGDGYESVALIPLRSGGEIVGLLQLNDRRRNQFMLEMIRFFEGLGASIGIALFRNRTEEALRESEERFRLLIENTGDIIYSVDGKGFLTYMNPTTEKILGYTHHELNGKSFAQIVSPECIASVHDRFKRAMKGKPIPVYEADLLRKDGTGISVEFNIVTVYDSEGKPSGQYGIGRDITSRKQAENEMKELYTVILKQNDWIVAMNRIVSGLSKVLALEEAGSVLISALKNELSISRCLLFIRNHGDSRELIKTEGLPQPLEMPMDNLMADRATQRVLGKGLRTTKADIKGPCRWDDLLSDWSIWPLKGKQGKLGFLVVDGMAPEKGDDLGMLLNQASPFFENAMLYEDMGRINKELHREIETRKQIEAELIHHRCHLEEMVEERTSAAKKNYDMLIAETTVREAAETARRMAEQELEKQRIVTMHKDRLVSLGEMAAGIAHELNQPLSGVRGLAEHLLIGMQRGWDFQKEMIREKLSLIVEQADRMNHVIEHVRMFAREAGKAGTRPVDVNAIAASSMDILGQQFKTRGLEIVFCLAKDLPVVEANPFSLEEVIINLLINARDATEERLKSHPEASCQIRVCTRSEAKESKQVVILQVIDRGAGIPAEVLPRVFDPFFTTKEPDKGTGLGLPICRTMVDELGGEIEIQSAVGEGTTVTVSIPAKQ